MSKNYHYRQFYIPARMMVALDAWVTLGRMPGGFLRAVLENNLLEACGRADDENLANLPAYAVWLYNEAPQKCYGSLAAVTAWETEHAQRRARVKPADAPG